MNTQQRIHHLRKILLRITQAQFASKLNISRSNLANIEQGTIGLTERVAKDICREFSVNLSWLMDGAEPVFLPVSEHSVSNIDGMYEQLNDDNKNHARGYIEQLLEEQQSAVVKFADPDLTEEEIEYLKKMLDRRRGGSNG
jgi:transcriptional regulator with XRE-family HTH domain